MFLKEGRKFVSGYEKDFGAVTRVASVSWKYCR
jgi:hypothetical protein